MFVTAVSHGYGDPYVCGSSSANAVLEMDMNSGQAGVDQNWNDATGRPVLASTAYDTCKQNITNGEGSCTPGGSGNSGKGEKQGTGMWLSSPVSSDGSPVAGTSTLKSGAQFQLCISSKFQNTAYGTTSPRDPNNWNNTNTLTAKRMDTPTAIREWTNGVDLRLDWTAWTKNSTTKTAVATLRSLPSRIFPLQVTDRWCVTTSCV